MAEILKSYFRQWWTIMLRPIYFYTKLKEEDWKEGALTFLIITAWLLSFFATLIVFVIQYVPLGSTLVEGISGLKLIIILPVMATLAFVFFSLTLLIFGLVFTLSLFIGSSAVAILLHYIYTAIGGRGKLTRMLQNIFYSSAVILAAVLIMLLAILTKYGGLGFPLFRVGFDFIMLLLSIYIYGLWAIAGRKVYGVPKWKAFIGAVVPVIALLIIVLLFDKIALSKLKPWVT